MTTRDISEDALLAQEAYFARAFAEGDPAIARDLYQPDVVYVSPTVRLFDWPAQIDGVERTLTAELLAAAGLRFRMRHADCLSCACACMRQCRCPASP